MAKLRMAVIGAGRLGGFHAQKLAAMDDVELLGVVDPLESSRRAVAAACSTWALEDYRPLLGRLDAAVVATPTRLHREVAADLLTRGVHVLVEKPICSTVAEADSLVDLARQRGLVLQVGHVERFNPAFTASIANRGEPRYLDAVRSSGFTFRSTDVGVVLDLMIHDIDLVLSLAGSPVRRVDAIGAAVVGPHEDVANARLEFESGCVASLSASRVSYEAARRLHVWSREGFAAVDFAARTTTTVRPSEVLQRREFHLDRLTPADVEYHKVHFAAEHLPVERREFASVDALTLELREFIASIREGRAPLVSGEAGRDALGVAEQIVAQIRLRNDEFAGSVAMPAVAHGPQIIPAPHFRIDPAQQPQPARKAG
ncbi:MAG: Gfo/Idh/MocA family oxidoreductase [Planctomycetota bacterium]